MTEAQGGGGRGRLVALVVAGLVAAALVAVALLTGGSDGSGLRIERSTVGDISDAELIVYVEDPGANEPATADGAAAVRVECLDARDAVVIRASHSWPFTDTDDGQVDPHVHQRSTKEEVDRIVGCRLAGTDPRLEGRVGAPR